jgi:hypothetical protein
MLLKQKEKPFLLSTQYVGASGQIYVEKYKPVWKAEPGKVFVLRDLKSAIWIQRRGCIQPASLLN